MSVPAPTMVHRALALLALGIAQDVVAAAPQHAGSERTAAPKPHLVYILSDNLYVSHDRARRLRLRFSHRRVSAAGRNAVAAGATSTTTASARPRAHRRRW